MNIYYVFIYFIFIIILLTLVDIVMGINIEQTRYLRVGGDLFNQIDYALPTPPVHGYLSYSLLPSSTKYFHQHHI